jgi:MFS family permease
MKSEVTARSTLLVLGCLVCQMGAGYFYATRALAPEVIADLGWTRTMWSSGMAPMLLVSSVAQVFVGAACVRFGVRLVVVSASLLIAASAVVLSTMTSLPQFYGAMVLLALGNAGIGDVSIGGVITRWFGKYRSIALGFAMVGTNIGAVVFVHAITSLSQDASWRRATITVAVGAMAVILPFAIFVVRDPRSGEGIAPVEMPGVAPGSTLEAAAADEEAAAGESAEEALVIGDDAPLAHVLRRPAFWALFYALFCYSFIQLGLYDHLVLYLQDLGYSREQAASALELAVGAGIIAKLGAGLIAMRVPAPTAFFVNTAILTLGIALVPFAADAQILTLFGLLFGISTSARDVLLPLAVADFFGIRSFSQNYGAMMLAFIPGGVLGPVLLARAHDLFGTYRAGFGASLILLIIATIALFILALQASRARRA